MAPGDGTKASSGVAFNGNARNDGRFFLKIVTASSGDRHRKPFIAESAVESIPGMDATNLGHERWLVGSSQILGGARRPDGFTDVLMAYSANVTCGIASHEYGSTTRGSGC
jgi:hypothetical protein